ncbi:hypothetical protein HAX54_043654 [Datura stramonium]|uniref:Uncharacterized protein n=1 Tax=Datura stramonium TaxID=4076 RepID=A0ABS8W4Y2_DATST|nr:hypothetical protein [Datura stramonium]
MQERPCWFGERDRKLQGVRAVGSEAWRRWRKGRGLAEEVDVDEVRTPIRRTERSGGSRDSQVDGGVGCWKLVV